MKGGYRLPYDASAPLRRFESGEIVWKELWENLHHQGDVDEASFAAVPHLVRISAISPHRDWNLYGLVALIEIERHRASNPPIPSWLQQDYALAWRNVADLALHDLSTSADPYTVRSALSVVALARGERKLGALLAHLDSSEIDEILEDKLAWSKMYR